MASEWNIKKFSNNRFNEIKLNENALPKISRNTYSAVIKEFNNPKKIEDKNLIIFENNISFELTDFKDQKFKKIYLVSNKNENREIKLSEKIINFKIGLIEDQKNQLKEKSIDCEIIDISEIKNIENCYYLYPCVGENLDYLNSQGMNS